MVVKPNRVHQLFSRTRVLAYVLAYSRTSFTQTPVDAWRKITFAAPAKNASNGISPNFRVTRAVLISDRCAINRRIVCAVFAHGGQTWPRGARARARVGGTCSYVWWVHVVVNLGCQTFEIHQFCILGVKRFASREHRTRDILPKRSATVPLDRRDGDDEVTRFWWSRTSQTDTRSRFNVLRYVTLTVVNLTDTSQCIQPLYSLQQVPNLLLHYRGGSGGSLPPAPPATICITSVVNLTDTSHCIQSYHILQQVPNLLLHYRGGSGGSLPPAPPPRYVSLLWWISLTLVNVFSLFTHCNKYRIYFYIIEGGPGGASPRHHLLDMYHFCG